MCQVAFGISVIFLPVQIAASLTAEKLILMTDVPGILEDKNNLESKYSVLDIKGTRKLMGDDIIAGGMIPKVPCLNDTQIFKKREWLQHSFCKSAAYIPDDTSPAASLISILLQEYHTG